MISAKAVPFCAFDRVHHVRHLATLSTDNRLKVWNAISGKLIQECVESRHLANTYTCLAFYSSSKSSSGIGLIAIGSSRGKIIIWNLHTSSIIQELGSASGEMAHASQVNHVTFNRNGTLLYSCGDDKTIKEWQVKTGEVLKTIKCNKATGITKLCLSPDNQTLLSATSGIILWELSSQKKLLEFSGHTTSVTSLRFTPDGKYFLSGASDRFVSLWGPLKGGTNKKKKNWSYLYFCDGFQTIIHTC